jgi:hypothetical protein
VVVPGSTGPRECLVSWDDFLGSPGPVWGLPESLCGFTGPRECLV